MSSREINLETFRDSILRARDTGRPVPWQDAVRLMEEVDRLEGVCLEQAEVNGRLLAYAECQEAHDAYDLDGGGFTKTQLDAVFVRHGLEAPVTRRHGIDQLHDLRRAALSKAHGCPAASPGEDT